MVDLLWVGTCSWVYKHHGCNKHTNQHVYYAVLIHIPLWCKCNMPERISGDSHEPLRYGEVCMCLYIHSFSGKIWNMIYLWYNSAMTPDSGDAQKQMLINLHCSMYTSFEVTVLQQHTMLGQNKAVVYLTCYQGTLLQTRCWILTLYINIWDIWQHLNHWCFFNLSGSVLKDIWHYNI